MIPDFSHLVGHPVRVTLNPWAVKGPTVGVFLGQSERGLSIQPQGGGRHTYARHEVVDVVRV